MYHINLESSQIWHCQDFYDDNFTSSSFTKLIFGAIVYVIDIHMSQIAFL